MKTVIIGHRGTGKTSLLKRIGKYYVEALRPVILLDLDEYICQRERKTIPAIFQEQGEAHFRFLERKYYDEVVQMHLHTQVDIYLSVGAGFQPGEKWGWRFLWVRRSTDFEGRVFFNRPRLNPNVSAMDEFLERVPQREQNYALWADMTYTLEEGFDFQNEAEKKILFNSIENLNSAMTLLPQHMDNLSIFWQQRKNWGLTYFELRDDLLNPEQIEKALKILPHSQILLSFRNQNHWQQTYKWVQQYSLKFDWPLEFQQSPPEKPFILSYHGRQDDLSATLKNLEQHLQEGTLLKFAVPIRDFQELQSVHTWYERHKNQVIVLPMSVDGRWRWYRLWMSTRTPFSFCREAAGSAADQPTLFEVLNFQSFAESQNFATILGDPVEHSWTPAEQFSFFQERKAPVLRIRVSEKEWPEAIPFLQKLGLKWAAVTSPLKRLAYELCQEKDAESEATYAVNTLAWQQDRWIGANTDKAGLQYLLQQVPRIQEMNIVLWGGGGTLDVMKQLLPKAVAYSAQTQKARISSEQAPSRVDLVVWGVGRSQFEQIQKFPPWAPLYLVDLNYAENSPGREYAQQVQAQYFSGEAMFRHQALVQRKFWTSLENPQK